MTIKIPPVSSSLIFYSRQNILLCWITPLHCVPPHIPCATSQCTAQEASNMHGCSGERLRCMGREGGCPESSGQQGTGCLRTPCTPRLQGTNSLTPFPYLPWSLNILPEARWPVRWLWACCAGGPHKSKGVFFLVPPVVIPNILFVILITTEAPNRCFQGLLLQLLG